MHAIHMCMSHAKISPLYLFKAFILGHSTRYVAPETKVMIVITLKIGIIHQVTHFCQIQSFKTVNSTT